jgi:hypothetical protein
MNFQDELRRLALAGNVSGATGFNTVMQGTPGSYAPSAQVNSAWTNLQTHTANQPGPYQSQWQTQIDSLLNNILNAGQFQYNVDTDPLYAQYKDKYVKEGRRAMQESMGGAAGLTGGYGSTAGRAAGQQAYGNYMTGLTDKIPELEQAAYQKWQNNLANQYNQYGALSSEEQAGYGRYRDTVGDWRTDRDYLSGWWRDLSEQDYGRYNEEYNRWLQERDYWGARAQTESRGGGGGRPRGPSGPRRTTTPAPTAAGDLNNINSAEDWMTKWLASKKWNPANTPLTGIGRR